MVPSSSEWVDAEGEDWEVQWWDYEHSQRTCKGAHTYNQQVYPGTDILLLGFDMTKQVSNDPALTGDLISWIEEFKSSAPQPMAIIVVGTKSDLYDQLTQNGPNGQLLKTIEEMHQGAVAAGAHAFICTSAKNGTGLLEDSARPFLPVGNSVSDTDKDERYLDRTIMKFGLMHRDGYAISKLESGKQAPPKPRPGGGAKPKSKAPVPGKEPASKVVVPKKAPAKAPAKTAPTQDEKGCCSVS